MVRLSITTAAPTPKALVAFLLPKMLVVLICLSAILMAALMFSAGVLSLPLTPVASMSASGAILTSTLLVMSSMVMLAPRSKYWSQALDVLLELFFLFIKPWTKFFTFLILLLIALVLAPVLLMLTKSPSVSAKALLVVICKPLLKWFAVTFTLPPWIASLILTLELTSPPTILIAVLSMESKSAWTPTVELIFVSVSDLISKSPVACNKLPVDSLSSTPTLTSALAFWLIIPITALI